MHIGVCVCVCWMGAEPPHASKVCALHSGNLEVEGPMRRELPCLGKCNVGWWVSQLGWLFAGMGMGKSHLFIILNYSFSCLHIGKLWYFFTFAKTKLSQHKDQTYLLAIGTNDHLHPVSLQNHLALSNNHTMHHHMQEE